MRKMVLRKDTSRDFAPSLILHCGLSSKDCWDGIDPETGPVTQLSAQADHPDKAERLKACFAGHTSAAGIAWQEG